MFIAIFIFFVILFLYIHIVDQYKRNDDLDILEMDYENNIELQKICNIRQPFVFEFKPVCEDFFNKLSFETLLQYKDNELKLKDRKEYFKEKSDSIDHVMLNANSCYKIIEVDSKAHYFTENNEEFVQETGLQKYFKEVDTYLKPNLTVQTHYDVLFGSKKCYTPFRHHINYRYFLCVTSGRINVKISTYKNHKFLHPVDDYENYEFRSTVDPWRCQEKHKKEFDKLDSIEFDVHEGFMLYIPPYWWYSIRFDTVDTLVTSMTYNTPMNIVSNLKHSTTYFLQQMNIHKKILGTVKTKKVIKNEEDNQSEDNSSKNDEPESVEIKENMIDKDE